MKQKKTMTQTTLGGKKPARSKTAKKGMKFIPSHLSTYALKIGSRNSTTSQVETLICRFCTVFGKERPNKGTATTRAPPTNPKFFNIFRTDLFLKHHHGQHPVKWSEYSSLDSDSERQAFFAAPAAPYVETLESVFESEASIEFHIKRDIVDVIIGQLLFHPDDAEGLPRVRALACFTQDGDKYKVVEKRTSRFRLCVRFLGRGASFHMTANLMDDTKQETGIGRFGGCTEGVVARYARVICAASLQKLSEHLAAAWTFSLALDCGTHLGRSYADVRCRFYENGAIENYHLLAIPLFERHTAANIFSVVQKFLDALVPRWRYQLLGVATDGAAVMIGSVSGLATLLEDEAHYKITRVWCGLHQLDLKMQTVFQQALHETYLSKLTALIGFLRRQQNLITEMGTTCPKVASTRWLSMYQVAKWLCDNGFRVRQYLADKKADCSPNLVWWVFLYALRDVARETHAVFVSLQGMSTLVKQQQDRLAGLVERLLNMSGAVGPMCEASLLALDKTAHETKGDFAISHEATEKYVRNLDLWVCQTLSRLTADQRHTVVTAVARLYVLTISSIDSLTNVVASSPPVTPKELLASSMEDLALTIDAHHDRLAQHFGDEHVYKIGLEFSSLRREYDHSQALREAISSFDHRLASFKDMWSLADAVARYPMLASFCGGIAAVFPNTATVEADFSLIGTAKTDKRTSLTDLALEGVLHCKQWQRLSSSTQ